MIETCTICQHAKRQAIYDAVASGRRIGVVSQQFRVDRLDLVKHFQHDPIIKADDPPSQALSFQQTQGMTSPTEQVVEKVLDAIDPMRRVKYHVNEAAEAWREVDKDRRTPERLQVILQDAFQSDDMGLP